MEYKREETFNFENITFLDELINEFDPEKSLEIIKNSTSFKDDEQTISKHEFNNSTKNLKLSQLSNNRTDIKLLNRNLSQLGNSSEKTDLKYWGLPSSIIDKYEYKGIKKMFNWQVECLNNPNILINHGNLIYSAPTSAGKTLVAEILTIKTVLERKKKVVIILPFVSLVREKMFYFQDIFNSSGIRVEGFMGSQSPPGGLESVHIAICTIEKANNLINHLLEDGCISDLGAIVVDELHLLGDPHRGYILELLLTKILYSTKKIKDVNIQIIGMSATLPNLDLLSNWLQAELYKTDFRPIPLNEHCLISNIMYNSDFTKVREMKISEEIPNDKDFVINLCLETIIQNCSVLIFCPSKNWCENLAQQISSTFCNLGYSTSDFGKHLREQLKSEKINEVLEQLKSSPVGLDAVLHSTISFGVAYHHAGLTLDERDIIEGAFKNNAIRVLVATSTLSSGVNLPARKVIIRSPMFNYKPINILTYKQMIGRAGRMGIDSAGESILICSPKERYIAKDLITGIFDPISSCLEGDDKLMRAVLEAIASGIATLKEDIELYVNCTLLLNSSMDVDKLNDLTQKVLSQLREYELIRLHVKDEEFYIATPLGKACLSSSMSPQDGLTLFLELQKARECFVLETDLHMIYLVTPYSICNQWGEFNWLIFLNLWESLSASMKRVGKLIGIQENMIYQCIRNPDKMNTLTMAKKLQIYKRFYTALALQDLVNEIPLNIVANKYNCSRGMLQSLQQSSSTFAGMVTSFTRQLGWKNFEILVSQFQDRLQFGIQIELLNLMKLQSLNGLRARAIYNVGIESICKLANANIDIVESALNLAIPFQSEKIREGENEYEQKRRNNIKSVWITGQKGVTIKEAAELLILEARTLLEMEIGVNGIKWKDQNENKSECDNQINTSTMSENKNIDDLNSFREINISVSNGYNNSDTKILDGLHSTPADNSKLYRNDSSMGDSSDSGNITHDSSYNISSDCSLNDVKKESNKNTLCSNFNKSSSIFGNDSSRSLFEDSLIIDTQLNGILDKKLTDPYTDANKPIENINVLENVFSDSFNINGKSYISNFDNKCGFDNITSNEMFDTKYNIIENESKADLYRKRKKISETFENDNFKIEKIQSPIKIRKIENNYKKSFCEIYTEKLNNDNCTTIKFQSLNTLSKNDFKFIQVCHNQETFNLSTDWLMNFNTFSLYCIIKERKISQIKSQIGSNLLKNCSIDMNITNNLLCEKFVAGLAIYVDKNEFFYINLQLENHSDIQFDKLLNFISNFFNDKTKTIVLFNCKNIFHILFKSNNIRINCKWEDPLIADWLLDAEGLIKSFNKMIDLYFPYNMSLIKKDLERYNKSENYQFLSNSFNAWIINNMMKTLKNIFQEKDLKMIDIFETEMRTLKILSNCELNGIFINKDTALGLMNKVKQTQSTLEINAFKMVGRRFKFSSSSEVAKVIGIYNGRKIKTNKRVLEQIDNPLAKIIIYWRKLNNISTKYLFPLISETVNYSIDNRIYGSYWTHTSTGRITMQEPNLQNIPRNFEIPIELMNKTKNMENSIESYNYFCCRNIFLTSSDFVLVSADYCQLELRLLAHMSGDVKLLNYVKSGEDIFKAIASAWKSVDNKDIDDNLRQKAKQMCYGIIYGMGIKTLAQNLDMCESDAEIFVKMFHNAYPGIKIFTNEVINKCKKISYVETLQGRRRYLPSINSTNISERAHAERQAVNTTIQGSAADILKSAMISIDNKISTVYQKSVNIKLVLLLHDEVMYEVPIDQLYIFSKLLKESMERTVTLSVPLPVKLKYGKSWGEMSELII